jgi:hypothetical protein
MSLQLRVQKILTHEELLNQRLQQSQNVIASFDAEIKKMLASQRQKYIEWHLQKKKDHLAIFLNERQPNETAEEFWLRKWARQHSLRVGTPMEHEGFDAKDEVQAYMYMGRMCDVTDHPAAPSYDWDADSDYTEREAWRNNHERPYQAWRSNHDRPPFEVSWQPDADSKLRKEAAREADEIIKEFTLKTNSKILDILLTKGDYTCQLLFGGFTGGSFEGDIKVTFTDKTTFRTHVILKTNYSVLGNAYGQYPLTFHDVQVKGKGPVQKMVSEAQIRKLLKVKKWSPPKVKKPWTKAGVGDVVRTALGLGLLMATRGEEGTVRYANGVEARVTGNDIEQVVAHTEASAWKSPPQVHVQPHEGKQIILSFPDFKDVGYSTNNAKLLRLFAVEKVLESVK